MFSLTGTIVFFSILSFAAAIHWRVGIYTSDLDYAGTDASVYMSIYGERGWSLEIELDDRNRDDNERDEVGVYDFHTRDIGRPIKLLLYHDNGGRSAGWHVSEVVLQNKNTATTYTFNVHRWIATDNYNWETYVEMEVNWWKYVDDLSSRLARLETSFG